MGSGGMWESRGDMSTRKPDDIRMPLTSANVVDERLERLRDLFPEAFREGTFDFQRLHRSLSDMFEEGRERYGLSWAGKAEAIRAIQVPSIGTLKPVPEESVDFDTTGNLFIEGDNLEVLKLLQYGYHGRIKMIYIDPPYNTGQEFVYTDNYRDSLGDYLRFSGQVGEDGTPQSTNKETEGRFHSRWLNMMYPRLFLARNLLAQDGVLFVSISDHEVCSLRAILDEILGEENFLAQIVWKARKFPDARAKTNISTDHEYVVVYGRSDAVEFRGIERDESKFGNPDNDVRGPWMSRSILGLATQEQRPNLHYEIEDPETGTVFAPPATTGWRYDKARMNDLISQGKILFPKSESGRPREKKFRSDLLSEFRSFPSIVDDVHTSDGTSEIRRLFGFQAFDFPKPAELIRRFVEQTTDAGDIVLDFFAGSGTTGQAVAAQTARDGKHRRWICVQLPERLDEKSEAFRKGYRTISDLAQARLKRVHEEAQATLDSDARDTGFKAFKLAPSNFRIWHADEAPSAADELAKQLGLYAENVLPGHSRQEILYELVLKAGFPLDVPIEERLVGKSPVFWIDGGALAICLEDRVTRELLAGIMELKPSRVLCLDHAFGENDQLKTNAVLEMKSHGMVFQTV